MNNPNIRSPIVAVFGSKEFLSIAELLAGEITCAGGILLSGGDGRDDGTVKNAVIVGAQKMRGRWLGVHRHASNDGFRTPSFKPQGTGLVLEPGLGHRRNFLEACLCDAAIAIKGGEGTISEVAACSFLGKPVILVAWESPIVVDVDWLIRDEYAPKIAALEHRLAQLKAASIKDDRLVRVPAGTSADEIVKKALKLVGMKRSGRFPKFLGDRFRPMSDAFEAFIA